MKDVAYDVSVAFTSDELVSCRCNCKAGCDCTDRSICVHVLTVMLLSLILMLDGLSEHILVELCHCWDLSQVNLEDNINDEDMKILTTSVCQLIQYSGMDQKALVFRGNVTISNFFSSFGVGTEKMKVFDKQPKPEELLPLNSYDVQSNNKMVKQKLHYHVDGELLCLPCSPLPTSLNTTLPPLPIATTQRTILLKD
jgi:hypothetical protein